MLFRRLRLLFEKCNDNCDLGELFKRLSIHVILFITSIITITNTTQYVCFIFPLFRVDIENTNIESLLPFKDEPDNKPDPLNSEEYKKSLQENRELTEAVTLKNKQLREIIDRIRIIIWEINTMLSMRRS